METNTVHFSITESTLEFFLPRLGSTRGFQLAPISNILWKLTYKKQHQGRKPRKRVECNTVFIVKPNYKLGWTPIP